MKLKISLIPAMAAVLLLPRVASAYFILDTGTPGGSNGAAILNSADWLAGEFTATAGETITSLSAYLDANANITAGSSSFVFDIYGTNASGTGFLNNRSLSPLFTVTATFSANGWNTQAVDWVAPSSGYYWLALQMPASSGRNPPSYAAPIESGTGTGTVPANQFAFATSGQYTASTNDPIGLEVTAVPLPASAWLLLSGLVAGFGTAFRRRRGASEPTGLPA
jgi:hypothetical protein